MDELDSGRQAAPQEHLVTIAARNNAEWCETICGLHRIAGEFEEDAWASGARTPEHYPDAVTLRRGVDAARLLSRVDASSGCSIKDSFADLTTAFVGASSVAARLFPRTPIVGYESGPRLDAAEQAGFVRVGRLVVWLRS